MKKKRDILESRTKSKSTAHRAAPTARAFLALCTPPLLPRLPLRVRSEFAKARSDSATLSCAPKLKGVVEIHVSGDKVSAQAPFKRRSWRREWTCAKGQCNERRRADELDRAGRGVAFEGAPYRPDCESMQTQETGPHLRPPPWTNDPKRKPR